MDALPRLALLALFWPVVLQLGNDDFRTRERASTRADVHLESAIFALKLGEHHADPEIKSRSRKLVNEWYSRHASELAGRFRPIGWDGWPWINTYQYNQNDNISLQKHAANWACLDAVDALGVFKDNWPRYDRHREATRLRVVEMVSARRQDAEIRAWVEEQAEAHRAWCKATGWAVPP